MFMKTNDKNTTTQNLWNSVKFYRNTSWPQEIRETTNKQPNVTLRGTKKRTKKHKVCRRK